MPKPQAGIGPVLLQIKAAGVNPIDWKVREGYMSEMFRDRLPLIPGVDMAGEIESVGDGVRNFRQGDPVYGYLGVGHAGTYAQYVAGDASAIARKPRKLDFVQAAAIPLTALVGRQTLFDIANL